MEHDNVNHPAHYMREGAMECFDEMVALFGIQAVKYFCLCNVWKYRYRAAGKNGEEDLKKSDWYMKRLLELDAISRTNNQNINTGNNNENSNRENANNAIDGDILNMLAFGGDNLLDKEY